MRIIHISDLHFGVHNTALVAPFLKEINELKPQAIIISGDLTQRARDEQFLLLRDFLQQLPEPLLIVPGNHDIPLYEFFLRLNNPFKRYKHYVSPELEAQLITDEVNILGVNSATPYKVKDGHLSKHTIERIKNHFSAAHNTLNILFFHHNLNYFSGMHHPLNNAVEFIDYLKDSPIHLVCTGHLHYSNVKLVNKNGDGHCAILHAGSLFCPRNQDKKNSYFVIDTQGQRCTVDWRVFSDSEFHSEQVYELNFDENIIVT